jgi:hypothetical protein
MYAERFTNGPYTIQNNGDQIKITLNVALDWFYLKIEYLLCVWGLLFYGDPLFHNESIKLFGRIIKNE